MDRGVIQTANAHESISSREEKRVVRQQNKIAYEGSFDHCLLSRFEWWNHFGKGNCSQVSSLIQTVSATIKTGKSQLCVEKRNKNRVSSLSIGQCMLQENICNFESEPNCFFYDRGFKVMHRNGRQTSQQSSKHLQSRFPENWMSSVRQ